MKAIVGERELVECYRYSFRGASEFDLAVAMASTTGIEHLRDALSAFCDPRKKNRARFLVGIDLPTPPEAIDELHSLATCNRERCEFRIYLPKAVGIFHPKLAIFRRQQGTLSAILGSSNLTDGGLIENREVNILVTDHSVVSDLRTWFEFQFNSDDAINVDASWLNGYRANWNARQRTVQELREIQIELRYLPSQPQSRPEFPGVAGYTVMFTGEIHDHWDRKRTLYRKIEASGGFVADRVHEPFDFLVRGYREGEQKLDKAHKENKPIVAQFDFFKVARLGRHALQELLRRATSVPVPLNEPPER
jgi:HKD family nuclease